MIDHDIHLNPRNPVILSIAVLMHSVLVAGGRAVILVPVFMFLYGTIDERIGHFRPYRRRDLLPPMREGGFTLEHSFYMNLIGIAGWFWNNRVRRIKEEMQVRFRSSIATSHYGPSVWRASCRRRLGCR